MNSKKFIFEMKKLVGKVFDVSINGVYRDKKDGGWYIQIERMEDIIKLGKANIFIHPIKKWRLDKYIEIKRGL